MQFVEIGREGNKYLLNPNKIVKVVIYNNVDKEAGVELDNGSLIPTGISYDDFVQKLNWTITEKRK